MTFDLDSAMDLSRSCFGSTIQKSTATYEQLEDMTAGLSYGRIKSLIFHLPVTGPTLALLSVLDDRKTEIEAE